MKCLIAFIFTCLFNTLLFSQDTLITKNGEMIGAKVLEINQIEIKYKKSANPDGPIYVIDRSEVVVIEYQNGTRDVFASNSNSRAADSGSENESVAAAQKPSWNISIGALPFILGPWNWGWGWGGRGCSIWSGWNWHRGGGFASHHHGGHYGRRGFGGGGRR